MTLEKSTYVKHTFYVLVANVIVLLIGFFSRPLIARFIGPDQYGIFALVFSTSTIISAVILLSLNSGVLYYAAKWNEDLKKVAGLLSSSIFFLLALSVIFFVPLYFILSALAPTLGSGGFFAAYALAFATSLFYVLQAAQQGLEKFEAYNATNVASAVLAGLASIAFAYWLKDAVVVVWVRVAASLLVAVVGLWLLGLLGKFSKAAFAPVLKYSLPLGVAAVFSSLIAVVDRYLIAAFYPASEVGFYDISYSLVTAILPFSVALLITMSPKVIKDISRLDAFYKRLSLVNLILLSAFALLLFYFSDIIIFVLLGKAYLAGAILPLKILSIALPLMAIYSLNGVVFTSINKPKITGILAVLLVVASIAFNFLLVPPMGGVGAAWANLCSYIIVAGIGLFYLIKNYQVTLGPMFKQLLLFLLFLPAYPLFLEQLGFYAKAAFFAVFLLLTFILNREAVFEILREMKKLILRRV